MTLIIIGLLLGIRHAFEPDHLAAVSTLATRPGSHLWSAARLGLVWGVGHTVTVGVLAFLLVGLSLHLPASLWPAGELVVAGLLILLGGLVIWRYVRGRWHMHIHTHGATQLDAHLHLHSHAKDLSHEHLHARVDARRSLGFGLAHGLAGSGAIAALLVAAAPDASARIAYFAAFGLGTIIGMLAVSLTLSVVTRVAADRGSGCATLLHVVAAAASVLVGVALAGQVVFKGL